MLSGRDGQPLRPLAIVGWASTWALGAALGVALGGYLTLVSGSGAPGTAGLDVVTDLVVLPLGAFAAVFGVYVIGRIVAGLVRSSRAPRPVRNGDKAE